MTGTKARRKEKNCYFSEMGDLKTSKILSLRV
jgi:hypothetical protein